MKMYQRIILYQKNTIFIYINLIIHKKIFKSRMLHISYRINGIFKCA